MIGDIEENVEIEGDIFSGLNNAFPQSDENSQFSNDDFTNDDNDGIDDSDKNDDVTDDLPVIDEADGLLGLADEAKVEEFNEQDFDKETESLSEGMNKKASDKFKELRSSLKDYKIKEKEVVIPNDVQTKLKDLELKAAEADGLRQQVEELSSVSAKVKVESSQEYKKKVLEPAMAILREADQIASSQNVESDIVQSIIKEGDKERQILLIKEHLSDMNEIEKQDLYRMIYEYKGLGKIRNEMLDHASEKLTQIEAQQIEEQKQLFEAEKKAVIDIQASIWDKYKTVIPGFSNDDGEPTEEWKQLRNRSLAIDFNKAAGKDKAYAAFAGVTLPHVIKELNAAKKLIQEITGKEASEMLRRPKLGQAPIADASTPDDFISLMRKTRFK